MVVGFESSGREGLTSELVHTIGRGAEGALWAGTSQGLVRFDGKDWRPLGKAELARMLDRFELKLEEPALEPGEPLPHMLDFFSIRFSARER